MSSKPTILPRLSQRTLDKRIYASLNVMVVEDASHMASIVCGILKSLSVRRIFEARSGGDALDVLNSHAIDMVLIDDLVGPLDGLSVVKEMRASKAPSREAPVILMTSKLQKSAIFQARDAGVTEVLSKPFSAAQLITRIESVLSHPRPIIKTDAFIGPDRRRRKKNADELRRASDQKDRDSGAVNVE